MAADAESGCRLLALTLPLLPNGSLPLPLRGRGASKRALCMAPLPCNGRGRDPSLPSDGRVRGRARLEPALQAEVDDLVEGAFLRAVAEGGERGAGGGAVGAGTLQRFREGAVGAQEPDRVVEVALLLLQVLERAAPEALLLLVAAAEGQHDRQRDLALAEVVADGLAKLGLARRIVEEVVDQLEGDAEVEAVG